MHMSFIKKLSKILTKFRKQILVVTLSLATASAIFGISFYFFYQENIQQYMNNNYSFKLYLTNISKNDTDTYSKLKESTYVKDVFLFNEKNAILNFPDRPAFDLIGTIPSNLNIIKGRDLELSNDYEMICPSTFAENTETKEDNLEIAKYLDQEISLKISFDSSNQTVKMKLVGLFDAKAGMYETDTCYTTHNTVKKINELSQNNVDSGEYINVYIQIDNLDNISKLQEDFPNITFEPTNIPSKDVSNLVCGIMLFIFVINLFITLLIIKEISQSIFKENPKYSNKELAIKCYTYELKLVLLSYLFGIILSILTGKYLISKIIPSIFLFYNTSISIKSYAIITTIIIITILVVLTNTITLKKVKANEGDNYE